MSESLAAPLLPRNGPDYCYSDYHYSNMKTCRIDSYVLDTLMADLVLHEHSPSAFLVYLHLWHGASSRRRSVRASHQDMAIATGLSKSAVQAAVRTLVRRRLVRAERDSITAVPVYYVLKPWRPAQRGGSGSA